MKNYVKMPIAATLNYLVNQDKERVKVTITIPTHRATPDYKEDPLALKVQVTEAEKMLSGKYDKHLVNDIMENIKEAESSVDHSLNMDGLVLYAGKDFATVVKVPVALKPEIIIGTHFDVRPIYKVEQQLDMYYVLTISQNIIRLLEAMNELPLREYNNDDFPFENTDYFTTDPEKLRQDDFAEKLIKEFYNTADKMMKTYMAENPLPLILAGDTKSVAYYREMMDDKKQVVGTRHGNFDNATLPEIIKSVYPVLQEYQKSRQQEYLVDIDNAESAHLAESNQPEINRLAKIGNADTLYIGNNYSPEDITQLLNIIEHVIKADGNIVFMDDELLAKYKGIFLKMRYS
jgi:hypothetical protein